MSAKANATQQEFFQHNDLLHSAAIIDENGIEVQITQEMIDKACDDERYEFYPKLSTSCNW